VPARRWDCELELEVSARQQVGGQGSSRAPARQRSCSFACNWGEGAGAQGIREARGAASRQACGARRGEQAGVRGEQVRPARRQARQAGPSRRGKQVLPGAARDPRPPRGSCLLRWCSQVQPGAASRSVQVGAASRSAQLLARVQGSRDPRPPRGSCLLRWCRAAEGGLRRAAEGWARPHGRREDGQGGRALISDLGTPIEKNWNCKGFFAKLQFNVTGQWDATSFSIRREY
jgi:hypothetical protein